MQKEYIYQGDIFQVVLSNRLEAEYEGSPLNTLPHHENHKSITVHVLF